MGDAGRALLACVLLATPALAQDVAAPVGNVAAGRKLAAGTCQSCHGMDGLPKMPDMPTIAGADANYLVKQLKAYGSGARENEMMSAVAGMLDEEKMTDAAAYYAAIKLEATPPP
ncbi:MAG TPA: c-type cytochrome [Acetobacteraceae bacterium]|jgi:cytochrome c553|nr:c-type cytochrome [Acetobacteraceae bacterium]